MPSGALAAIDLDDPEDNLRAFIKLIGSLDGRPVYDIVRGSVYALVPGRPAQPLFRTVGAGVALDSSQSENDCWISGWGVDTSKMPVTV